MVVVEVGVLEAGHPVHCGQRVVAGPAQRLDERAQLRPARYQVESADLHVDRVDRPAAEQGQQFVARLLDRKAALDDRPVIAGQLHRARVPEEVRRVQQVDVQRVALDPFAAVQQPAQVGEGTVHSGLTGVLDRGARRHLVRHRADPAHPGGDVGYLGVPAADQQRLEEPGRLVDLQLHIGHPVAVDMDVHRALALDPGQPGDAQRPVTAVGHRPAAMNAGAAALKVRNTKATSRSSRPRSRNRAISAGVLTGSAGPKQP